MDCPDEDGVRHILRTGHHIHHLVDAVAQIDIGMPSRTKHHLRPGRAPVVPRVGGPILGAAVGFRLRDDPRGDDPVNAGDQLSSEKVTGEGDDVV